MPRGIVQGDAAACRTRHPVNAVHLAESQVPLVRALNPLVLDLVGLLHPLALVGIDLAARQMVHDRCEGRFAPTVLRLGMRLRSSFEPEFSK